MINLFFHNITSVYVIIILDVTSMSTVECNSIFSKKYIAILYFTSANTMW